MRRTCRGSSTRSNATGDGFGRIGAALAAVGLPTVLVQEGGYLSPRLGEKLQAALGGFEEER
jgi:acetoin utilization deacetylase AcuC-like enzyme